MQILCSRMERFIPRCAQTNWLKSNDRVFFKVERTSTGALRPSLVILMFVFVQDAVLSRVITPRMVGPIFLNSSGLRHSQLFPAHFSSVEMSRQTLFPRSSKSAKTPLHKRRPQPGT